MFGVHGRNKGKASVEIDSPRPSPTAHSEKMDTSCIIKFQNGLGWKGPQSPPGPTPCHGQGCPPPAQLPRAPSNLALSASRDGAPQLLWAAVPVPHCPLSGNLSPKMEPQSPLFQVKIIPPILSCNVGGESHLLLLTISLLDTCSLDLFFVMVSRKSKVKLFTTYFRINFVCPKIAKII